MPRKRQGSDRTADIGDIIEQYQRAMAAYSGLILSMDTAKEQGKVAFEIVKQAKTADNPNGNPYLVLKNLTKKIRSHNCSKFHRTRRTVY